MGQAASSLDDQSRENLDRVALEKFSRVERYSLGVYDTTSVSALLKSLRLPSPEEVPGVDIVLRSAEYFASFPDGLKTRKDVTKHLLKVIGLYDGRLRGHIGLSESDFRRHLFLSIAATSVSEPPLTDENSYYIAYDDILALFQVLTAVFDTIPQQCDTQYQPMEEVPQSLLASVEAPIIRWNEFEKLLGELPFVQDWFALIWDRLLFDPKSTKPPPSPPEIVKELPRDILCKLWARHGTQVGSTLRLFKGSVDGFALRAFETHVAKWRKSTILLVSGRTTKKSSPEIDQILPPAYDAPPVKANHVQIAVMVSKPWKMSAKHTFSDGETEILLLSPQYQIYRARRNNLNASGGFLSSGVGLGFGLSPQQLAMQHARIPAASVALAVDDRLEYGALRVLSRGNGNYDRLFEGQAVNSRPYELRFLVSDVQVWGIGSENDLKDQRQAWEWEEREAARRQNINVHEDRALLEMAGLVGNYNPDRG